MHRIYLALFCICFAPLVLADSLPISAQEIARHLGIQRWRVSRDLLPERYTVAIRKIEKGQLTDYVGSYGLYAKGDLIVCAHEEAGGGLFVTADSGEAVVSFRGKFGHSVSSGAPELAGLGVHVLFASYTADAKGTMVATGKIGDIVDGAVLIIENRK